MPALSWDPLLSNLVSDNINSSSSLSAVSNATNSTGDGLQVICAWPVSGQYGPGSRILYYVLIAACVLARKAEWIKNACLAAALLLPAVAALHAIVLAALHRDGAVDMDIYGAFQLCAIGILVAPVTVRLSKTYFYEPGRNTIFLWAGLILAGLLSLTVEFYRIKTFTCTQDGDGHPVSSDPSKFPYGDSTTCGLVCSPDDGPFSPMRGGSANNIYVVPAPDKLTFGAATLLAAGCCVYAILWLVSMLDKIFEISIRSRFGDGDNDSQIDEPISGTNATKHQMRSVNDMIRFFLSVAVVPVFGGAAFAVLVVGERNFFSHQVFYMNEPLASIGQWAPIVGTGLAALGSLYLLLAADVEAVKEEEDPNAVHHCKCSHHPFEYQNSHAPRAANSHLGSGDSGSTDDSIIETPDAGSPVMRQTTTGLSTVSSRAFDNTMRPSFSIDLSTTISRHITGQGSQAKQPGTTDSGSRRKVAKIIIAMGNSFGAAAQDWFDDSQYKRGRAGDFPEIPGEENRNRNLPQIREQYNPQRDAAGNATPVPRSRSRASSFVGSVASRQGIEGSMPRVRAASPRPALSPSRSRSPQGQVSSLPRQRASTMPIQRPSFEPHTADSASSTVQTRGRQRARRDTLEVPSPVHHNPLRIHYSEPVVPTILMSGGRGTSDREDKPASPPAPTIEHSSPESGPLPPSMPPPSSP